MFKLAAEENRADEDAEMQQEDWVVKMLEKMRL